jgi:hypothetical protein
VYNGPDKLLAETVSHKKELKSSASEFEKLAVASFPKAEELSVKEKRYAEVMEALKKESEGKAKAPVVQNDIDWENLKSLSPDKVRETVASFLSQNSIEEIKKEPIAEPPDVKTAVDIQAFIKSKYSIDLSQPLVATIDAGIASNKLNPEKTLELASNTIEQSLKNGHSWRTISKDDLVSAFCKEKDKLLPGDFLIKRNTVDSNPDKFDAYRIVDDTNHKYLGSDAELGRIIGRIEHYAVSVAVKDVISASLAASVSKESSTSDKEYKQHTEKTSSTSTVKEPKRQFENEKGLDI